MAAIVQCVFGCEGPVACGGGLHGAEGDAIVIDGHRGVSGGSARQGWSGIVGDLTGGGEWGLDRANVVGGRDNGRCRWRQRIHRQGKGTADRTGIPGGIGGRQGHAVQPVLDEGVRRKGPAARRIHHRVANLLPVDKNANRGSSFTGAGKGWTVVVGDAAVVDRAGDGPDIIHHAGEHRSQWGNGIYVQREGRRGARDVTCRIGSVDAQRVRPLSQIAGRNKAPATAGVDQRGADFDTVIQDVHGAARHAGAGQFWPCIVGELAADQRAGIARYVVVNADQHRGGRWGHIDGQNILPGERADVTGGVGCDGGKAMFAFSQHRRWRKAPDAAGVGQHGAEQAAAFVDGDAAARFRATRQGWRVVVGEPAAGDVTGDRANVIIGAGDNRCSRHGINHQRERIRAQAFVARRIGGAEGQGISAVVQRLRQGKAPGTGGAHRDATKQGIAGIDVNHIPRRRRAVQYRLVVVGRSAADHRSGDGAHVIHQGAKHRCSRWRQIDIDRRRWRLAAGLAINGGGHAEAVAAFPKGRDRECPGPGGGIGSHRAQRGGAAVLVNGDQAARDRRTGEGRGGVVGAAAFDVDVTAGAVVIQDGIDRRDIRQRRRGRDVIGCRAADVARRVAGGQGEGHRIALRRGQGHGELPLRVGHGGAQHHVIRASDRNGGTRFGGAGQRCTAGNDVGNRRRIRCVSINDHADRAALAGVARRIARYHGEGMRSIRQRRADRDRQRPLPLCVDLHLANRIAVNGDGNGAQRFAGAAQRWGAAVSVERAVGEGAVGDLQQLRDCRWHGVDGEGKVTARLADVPRGIHCCHGEGRRAIFQHWRGDGPGAVADQPASHFDTVAVENNGGAVLPGAGDGWDVAVAAAARRDIAGDRPNVIIHAGDDRDLRHEAVDGHGHGAGKLRDVARLVGGSEGEAVRPLGQRRL